MNKEIDSHNILEAKKSIKSHIKFLESLLKHLKGSDLELQAKSLWVSWCLHRYFNDGLMNDIETALREFGGINETKN